MSQYNIDQTRLKAQGERMKSLAARNICAFCPEHIRTETTSDIDIETDHWFVKANDYPYANTKHHLLIIPKEHAKTISDLSPAALQEFMPLVARIEKQFQLESYAVAMRSGDMRRNGSSVEHIHAHVIVGDTENPDHEIVRFKVSSRPN